MDKLFAVLGMGSNVANDLLFKVIADDERGKNTNLFYTLQALFIVPLCAVIILFVDREYFVHLPSILYGLPVGILTYVSYTLMIRSLVASDAAVSVTVYRLNFVTTSVLGIVLLREALTARKLIGLGLCLAAILAFLFSLRQTARSRYPGLKFSVAALVAVSALNIANKIALSSGAEILPLILYRYVVVAAIGGTVMAVRRTRFQPTARVLKAGAASSLIMIVSLYFIFTALKIGEVSVVIPITQLSFIFTAAFAFLLLKEKLNVLKLLGIALAVSSIVVLA
jgi:uncharacterized membrane protein